jgi:hypothetical protein
MCPRGTCLLISLVVIRETHDVVLAQIVTKLNFDNGQADVATVSQTVIGFGRNVNVLTLSQLQLPVATDNVGHAFNHNPMFAAARMSLQAQSRARFHFQQFDLKTGFFFQNFVAAPGSLVKFSHAYPFLCR